MKKAFSSSMVLLAVILMDMLAGAEVDLFVPSFPELKTEFNLSPFWVEALLSVNFIGYCLSLLFVGMLADRYGRRPVILVSLTIFIIGSVLCVLGTSYKFLLIGRFLQGIGVAGPCILAFLIITDSYSIKNQQYLLAMMNGIMNISVAAAPVVGSYVTMYFHWQGNFIVLLLLGIVTLIMTALFVPAHKLAEHREPISLSVYLPLLQSKHVMLLIMSLAFIGVPYWVFVGMSPLLYMTDLKVSLSHFGYYQGALAFVFAVGSIFYGLIMKKYAQKKMLSVSNQIFIASVITIALVAFFYPHNALIITLAFLPFVIGQIIPITILYPLCLSFMPQAKGRVSAVIQGIRLIVTAVGLEFAGYYYQGSFRNIGIILICLIIIAVITLFLVIKNRQIMR